jgi:hypothetical protein
MRSAERNGFLHLARKGRAALVIGTYRVADMMNRTLARAQYGRFAAAKRRRLWQK